jgi:hypothetical protein
MVPSGRADRLACSFLALLERGRTIDLQIDAVTRSPEGFSTNDAKDRVESHPAYVERARQFLEAASRATVLL